MAAEADHNARSPRFTRHGTALIVEGDLDAGNAAAFARELHHLVSAGASPVTVDLTRVAGVDDSALGELQDAVHEAGRTGIDLVVVPPAPTGPDGEPAVEQLDGRPARFERSDRAYGRTLSIDGEVDMVVAEQMQAELSDLIFEAHSPAFVDLSAVTFMDAAGVDALVGAARAGVAAGSPIVLVGASVSCRRVLDATGVWDLFRTV